MKTARRLSLVGDDGLFLLSSIGGVLETGWVLVGTRKASRGAGESFCKLPEKQSSMKKSMEHE